MIYIIIASVALGFAVQTPYHWLVSITLFMTMAFMYELVKGNI